MSIKTDMINFGLRNSNIFACYKRNRRRATDQLSAAPSPVERVEHLDDDERGQRHGGRVVVLEDVAVDTLEALVLHQTLRLVRLRPPTTRDRHCACHTRGHRPLNVSFPADTVTWPSKHIRWKTGAMCTIECQLEKKEKRLVGCSCPT